MSKSLNDNGNLKATALQMALQVETIEAKEVMDLARDIYDWLDPEYVEEQGTGRPTHLHPVN